MRRHCAGGEAGRAGPDPVFFDCLYRGLFYQRVIGEGQVIVRAHEKRVFAFYGDARPCGAFHYGERAFKPFGFKFEEGFFETTSISCEEDRIEKVVSGRDAGCGIRVIKDYKTYYVYTNELTEEGLLSAASVAANAAGRGSFEKDISLVRKDVAQGFLIKKKAIDIPLPAKIDLVKRGNIAGRGVSNVVKQVKVAYGDSQKKVAIVNSLGEWVEEELNYLIYFCF